MSAVECFCFVTSASMAAEREPAAGFGFAAPFAGRAASPVLGSVAETRAAAEPIATTLRKRRRDWVAAREDRVCDITGFLRVELGLRTAFAPGSSERRRLGCERAA